MCKIKNLLSTSLSITADAKQTTQLSFRTLLRDMKSHQALLHTSHSVAANSQGLL
jgi:hypothetical protein